MSSVCSIVFLSSTSVSSTTWVTGVRRPSSRWSSSTVRWAAHASVSGRSAPEQLFSTPQGTLCVRWCLSANRDLIFFSFNFILQGLYWFALGGDANLHSFILKFKLILLISEHFLFVSYSCRLDHIPSAKMPFWKKF